MIVTVDGVGVAVAFIQHNHLPVFARFYACGSCLQGQVLIEFLLVGPPL
jgi:hypothetical protein